MDSLIDLLGRRDSFDQLLKSLLSKIDVEDQEKALTGIQPLMERSMQGGWFKRHIPENNNIEKVSPINIFILLVTYSWVYAYENTTANSKASLQLFVVLAKYIWPLYQLFLLPDSGITPGGLSNEDVKNWLMDSRNYQAVIEELDVEIPPEVAGYASVEIRKDSATISRWLATGLTRLHKEMCTILDIEPVYPGEAQKAAQASRALSLSPVKTEDHEVSKWTPPQSQMEEFVARIKSPINTYFTTNEIIDAMHDLWRHQKSFPTPGQTAEFYIERFLGKTSLDNEQRIKAEELLSDIPVWCATKAHIVQPIPLMEIDKNWRGLYSEHISPAIINELLKQGLLVQDGRGLCIKDPLVFDYFLARRQFEGQDVIPIPPMDDIQLSRWLYWILQGYCDRNELEKAGEALWQIQGYLPGYFSGSWERIIAILDILPDSLLSDSKVWILASIAVKCRKIVEPYEAGAESPLSRLISRLPEQPVSRGKEADDCVNEYLSGLDKSRSQAYDEPTRFFRAVTPNLMMTRKKWSVKKHALSSLRLYSPETTWRIDSRGIRVAGSILVIHFGEIALQKVLLSRLRKASSEKEILAIAEPVVRWGIHEADRLIPEMNDIDKGYRYRSWILRQAAKGIPGYVNWV
jgi:hypothetical protein